MIGMDEGVLGDACYYLIRLGMPIDEIGDNLGIDSGKVKKLANIFAKKLQSGDVRESAYDEVFWKDIMKEARGDFRLTLVDKDGHFYHGQSSELVETDIKTLLAVLENNQALVKQHPEIESKPPVGHDPLGPLREVKASIPRLEEILRRRLEAEQAREPGRTMRS